MKKFLILIITIFYASSILAQNITFNNEKIKQKNYLQEIPYKKTRGVPLVPVTINGKTYNFVFDTGAMLVISDKLYKKLSLPIIGRKTITGSSGENRKMRCISLPTLNLQELTFVDTQGVVFHEDSDFFECLGIDGIIGGNMLRNFIVHFDEQNEHIIITNDIKNISINKKEYLKMKLSKYGNPFITITLRKGEKSMPHRVLFDSGQNAFFVMSTIAYLWSNGLADTVDKIAESEGSSAFGVHGLEPKQQNILLNVPGLVVGKTTFNNVIINTTHFSYSRIGAELFRYGKTTLDFKKKRFYFEPYDNINTDELSKYPPSIGSTLQNNKRVVGIIWDKSLESQINLGDEILSINGIDLRPMDFCELFTLDIPDCDKCIYELKDVNTGEIKEVEVSRMWLKE